MGSVSRTHRPANVVGISPARRSVYACSMKISGTVVVVTAVAAVALGSVVGYALSRRAARPAMTFYPWTLPQGYRVDGNNIRNQDGSIVAIVDPSTGNLTDPLTHMTFTHDDGAGNAVPVRLAAPVSL